LKNLKKTSDTLDLDFEKDVVTTVADIKALRTNRPISSTGDLRNLNRLRSPFPAGKDVRRRKISPDQPPFEIEDHDEMNR